MILTVTPNPALDVTYAVPRLVPGGVHRVRSVTTRAGGKGVNVARVLTALGEASQVIGLGGGPSGARLVDELEADGLTVSMLDVLPDVRRTLVVDDGGAVTSFWEGGVPPVGPVGAEAALLADVEQRLTTADAITVSASLPPGLDSSLPSRVGALALRAGVPAVLELDGDALRAAASVAGAVLMLGQRGLVAASAAEIVHARLDRRLRLATGPAPTGCRGDCGVGRSRRLPGGRPDRRHRLPAVAPRRRRGAPVTLAPMHRIVAGARQAGRGIGAFNVITLEHAEAIVRGAEEAELPVVVQLSENTADYHGSLAPLALACLRLAQQSDVDVCVHLDHATRPELVKEAVALGIGSVMVDASAAPYEDNVRLTRELTSWCHERGVWVEAELGEVGGKDGVHHPAARTDPQEAARYVDDTGVDALAVAVGSSHAMAVREAVLDFELIGRIGARLQVPLVLHGSSGVDDDGLARAVRHGMLKVNIATHLNALMTAAVRGALEADPGLVDPRRYLGPGRRAVQSEVTRLLRVLGAAPATGRRDS